MNSFKLTDPVGSAPTEAPFVQSVSRGLPWGSTEAFRDVTLGQVLDETIAKYGPHEAVVFMQKKWRCTWFQLGEEVDRAARGLMSIGVEKGEHVALWATNVPEWVILMLACAKIGAVLMPLNTNCKLTELEHALGQGDVSTIVTMEQYRDTDCIADLRSIVPELRAAKGLDWKSERFPRFCRIISLGRPRRGVMSWSQMLARAPETSWAAYQARQTMCSTMDVVCCQYTSGTTGLPKGACLTHRNVVNNAYWVGACMKFTQHDRVCVPVPLFHVFGYALGIVTAVDFGATLVMLEKFDPVQAMMAIEYEKCTALYGVPTMYISILDHPLFNKFDFTTIRTGMMSGAPCPLVRMQQTIERMGMSEICVPYGLTEAGPVMTMTRAWESSVSRRCDTVGLAMPGVEVAVIDPETHELAPLGANGELCCRGYNTMAGYYNMPEETAATLDENGWLHSGDLGRMDAAGYFHFVGRIKDIIIRGGENISAAEVENFLSSMPGISDVSVVGVPSRKYGEQPAAFVICQPGAEVTEDDIGDFCRGRLAWFKIPKYICFVKEFPLTGSRKVKKFKLRERARELWPNA